MNVDEICTEAMDAIYSRLDEITHLRHQRAKAMWKGGDQPAPVDLITRPDPKPFRVVYVGFDLFRAFLNAAYPSHFGLDVSRGEPVAVDGQVARLKLAGLPVLPTETIPLEAWELRE